MIDKSLQHLALILDGNGRWATQQNKSRIYGHEQGFKQIKTVINLAIKEQIKYLTLFCFSTENWHRSLEEVNYLMQIPKKFVDEKKFDFLIENKIKINHLGRKAKMPSATLKAFNYLENLTANYDEIIVNIAFDYGSYEELTKAIKNIVIAAKNKNLKITEKLFIDNLYTKHQPLVDLLIRTGGEKRLSNFLLLQLQYAELYFTDILWPDFDEHHFYLAIKEYNNRKRKFGRIE